MKAWKRISLILVVIASLLTVLSGGVSAATAAQILQTTPTPAAETTADEGAGQSMAIMKAEADRTTVLPGESVSLVLQIDSTGTRQLEGPRVICQASPGLHFTNVTSSRGQHIEFWEGRFDVDVVNLQYGDSVTITAVGKVQDGVAEGTALVTHCTVDSAYVGSQEAIIGVSVGSEEPKMALPQTGGGMLLVLAIGLLLAIGLVLIRRFRYQTPAA
jgi:LPXTG-motif cell wall-anchored protein